MEGLEVPGARVMEVGTQNTTSADLNGKFDITTIKDTCTIEFSWIGYESQRISIVRDTIVEVTFEYFSYTSRWLTIGMNYEFFNSLPGLIISNGYNEQPLIHFEDFDDKILLLIHGNTDFKESYSYGIGIGLSHPFRFLNRISAEFSAFNCVKTNFDLIDFNISAKIGYFRNTLIIFKTGYQKLQNDKNIGLSIGVEQVRKNIYWGFLSGYYFDYFHHTLYIQYRIPGKSMLTLRTAYNRIHEYNVLTFGINYTFIRNNNR